MFKLCVCVGLYALQSAGSSRVCCPCERATALSIYMRPFRVYTIVAATAVVASPIYRIRIYTQIKAPLSTRTNVSSMKNVDRITSEPFDSIHVLHISFVNFLSVSVCAVLFFLLSFLGFLLQLAIDSRQCAKKTTPFLLAGIKCCCCFICENLYCCLCARIR